MLSMADSVSTLRDIGFASAAKTTNAAMQAEKRKRKFARLQ